MDIKRKEEFYEWMSYEWMKNREKRRNPKKKKQAHLRSVLFVVLW